MDSTRKEMLIKERIGEIALAPVKEDLRRGCVFYPIFKGELGNIDKAIGILLLEELVEFKKILIKYLFRETLW